MEFKERKKVESCKSIEAKVQLKWASAKVFEVDAPKDCERYFLLVGIQGHKMKLLIYFPNKSLMCIEFFCYEFSEF